MVGAADDGNSLSASAHLGADHLAHEGLSPSIVIDLEAAAHPFHRLAQVREVREGGRAPVLDGVLPPALGVVVARCRRERGDRVDAPARTAGGLVRVAVGQVVRRGQVGEAHVDAVVEGPPQRDPLGGEDGERVERRPPRLVDGVDEPGDRRHEVGVGGERHERVELGRALDDDDVGLQLVERTRDGPRGARTVVPDAEHLDAGTAHAQPSSRHAR